MEELQITIKLPISQANAGMKNVIALMHQWDDQGQVEDFLIDFLSKKELALMQENFYPAIYGYCGVAGKAQADTLKTEFDTNLSVEVKFIPATVIIPTSSTTN